MSIRPDKPRRSSIEVTESWAGDASLAGDREPLEVLADEFTKRCRDGEHPSIEEYAERCPELADEIQELFPTIAAMEQLKVGKERSAGGQASLRGVQLERLGDFRIIREVGRGGMGIVYEAEQESLGRRVAVKVLPKQALLDEKHLKRFQREARTAAGLHHTNIVPVFGVGDDDGYHYYVMQLIDGAGLDRCGKLGFAPGHFDETRVALGDTTPEPIGPPVSPGDSPPSTEVSVAGPEPRRPNPRIIARIGIQAADALDYAHQHGVLHRDIKPANLILDSDGMVWVTDFGLAKVLEQENVTRTGDVVGTLRYMSPEHLAGVQFDGRSDIYSLGITLYELLTGQPAFGDLPQGQMVKKIVAGDIARPRQLNEAIPHDLETIVLKAIARESKDRYQSACALAIDLRLFLDDVPPLARRTTAVEHFWRWCRRNRLVAGLAATAIGLLVLVAVTTTVGLVRTNAALAGEKAERERAVNERNNADAARKEAETEREIAVAERERADAERKRAEEATELGLQVLDGIYERFAPRFDPLTMMTGPRSDADVSLRPVLSQDTAEMLEEMLVFYDRLAGNSSDDGRVRRKRAQASRRVGDIRKHLRQFGEAVDAYQRAISIYSELDDTAGNSTLALERGRIQNELGRAYSMTEQPEKCRRSHLEAAKTLETASGLQSIPDARYELARTYYFLAEPQRWDTITPPHAGPTGRPEGPPKPDDAPLKPHHAPRPHLRPAHPPSDHAHPTHPDMGFGSPKHSDMGHGPPKHSDVGHKPTKPPRRRPDSNNDTSVKDVRQRALYLCKAIDLLAEPGTDAPSNSEHAVFLVFVYRALGTLHGGANQLDAAAESYRKAVSIQSALAERLPEVASYQEVLGRLQQQLAMVLFRAGELDQARQLLESSVEVLSTLLQTDSSMVSVNRPLAVAYHCLADVYLKLGEDELADESRGKADQSRRLMPHGPPDPLDGRPKEFGPGKYRPKPATPDF